MKALLLFALVLRPPLGLDLYMAVPKIVHGRELFLEKHSVEISDFGLMHANARCRSGRRSLVWAL